MISLRTRLRRWLGIDSPDSLRLAVVEDSLAALVPLVEEIAPIVPTLVPRVEKLEAGAVIHADAAQRLAYYELHSGALSHWRAKYIKQRTS